MPHPKVKIADNSGNEVAVTSNALDVNIASGTADIDIGDVSLLLDGTAAHYGAGNVADGGRTLRVTLASDDPAVVSLDEIEGAVETIEQAIGTDGSTGPSKCISIGGTYSTNGSVQEIRVNSSGELMVDLATASTGASGATVPFKIDSVAYNTGDVGIMAKVVCSDTLATLTNVTNGEISSLQVNTLGALYVTGGEVENAAVQSEPLLVGGRYDSSARTLGDGDAGAIALTSRGYVKIDWTGDTAISTSIISAVQSPYGTADRNLQVAPAVRNDTLAALTNSTDGDWTPIQTDALGAVYTTHGITGMVSDRNIAVSDSTAEQLNGATDGSYDQACKRVDLQAALNNTGFILVGDSGILANLSGGGIKLNPGDFYSMDVNNVGDIYVLAETDGEDIYFTYFT